MKHFVFPILSFVLLASACTSSRYVAHTPAYPPRAEADVVVAPHVSTASYHEAGVIEVVANNYPDAMAHFRQVGAENGCHAVVPFTTRTNVYGGQHFTASDTVYLGTCLVPRRL